jgi:predicted CoA-binding protein
MAGECEIPTTNATSDEIAEILRRAKTIAVIGAPHIGFRFI